MFACIAVLSYLEIKTVPSRTILMSTVFSVALLLGAASSVLGMEPALHHDLTVQLEPEKHLLDVHDTMTPAGIVKPDESGAYHFVLHAGLAPEALTKGWHLEAVKGPVTASFFGINATTATVAEDVPLAGWKLLREDTAPESVEIRYHGTIYHPLAQQGEEYQRSFSETPGLIGEEGVFLSGTSFWVPSFGDGMVTFSLQVEGLKAPWDSVSQGGRTEHATTPDGSRSTTWDCPHPTEEIYLIAGPWTEYSDMAGKTEIFAFLRTPDPALANKYLQATKRYLRMYESILPDYPYASFSMVENFWETGYGMPGFTLLGPQIIRFPWILTSSYPHEILHNWWGNSVYVDTSEGNWCEGITAYMADHLLAEQRGEGETYRRGTLKKFTDFVKGGEDQPLTAFRSRHSAASEAVGYGKALMLFHMVRMAVGDDDFRETMKRFARRQAFTRATYTHIANLFTERTRILWRPFFLSWISRTGAPSFEIASTLVRQQDDEAYPFLLEVVIRQTQEEDPFPVFLPLAVTLEGQEEAQWVVHETRERETTVRIPCASMPLRLDFDPRFDLMRRLDPLEVPPALSTVFGNKDPLFVLPSAATGAEREAWMTLAKAWKGEGEPRTVLDSEIDELPGGSLWVLGWKNRFGSQVAEALAPQGLSMTGAKVTIGKEELPQADHSLVLVSRQPDDPEQAVAWVTAEPTEAIAGLARKLPHYTRYSYLAFRGPEPQNMLKGMWKPLASPLVRQLSDKELPALVLPERKALAELPPAFDETKFRENAEALASEAMRGRGVGTPELEKATTWVEQRLSEIGLEPAGEDGFRQSWLWRGGEPRREIRLTNLIARIPGRNPALTKEPVVVLAHIDHLGLGWPDVREGNQGKVHPGADDNASGVAVLIELARAMAADPAPERPVIFAVVTAEEAGLVGSRHFIGQLVKSTTPYACVNLDTVGRLADDKLYVLNADTAREWRFIFMGIGYTTGVHAAIVPEPLDSSDQIACIENGIPAVQLFTGPHADYHRPSDTLDKLDYAGMASVAEVSQELTGYLAGREEPLTVTIKGKQPPAPASGAHPGARGPGRRVSLGTMPDFSFEGPGVRVQQVMEESAAAAAGIKAGDIIVAIDGVATGSLRAYSDELKKHAPGDSIRLDLRRGDESLDLRATLKAR